MNDPITTPKKKKRNKLNTAQRMRVLALLARGDSFAMIHDHLQNTYGVDVHDSTISQIKKTHADTLATMTATIAEAEAADAESLLAKSRRMIGRKLQKAEADTSEIQKLDRRFRNGEISHLEYERERRGLLELSIQELTTVSKEMFNQSNKGLPPGSPPPGLPAGGQQEATEALLGAIARGDTVEIQRLILNPAKTT